MDNLDQILNAAEEKVAIECQQGSPEWHKARLGRFTGSVIDCLMVDGKDASGFGVEALGMIEDKAWEIFKGVSFDPDISNLREIQHGNKYEDYARSLLLQDHGYELVKTGFKQWGPYGGGSSDWNARKDGVEYVLEIKCPIGPRNHRKNIGLTAEQMAAGTKGRTHKGYFWQCQNNMGAFGLNDCLYVSCLPAEFQMELWGKAPFEELAILHVPAMPGLQTDLLNRIALAGLMRDELLNGLMK